VNIERARRPGSLSLACVACVALGPLAGCSPTFDPPSLVESVRLLAISADQPYAAPGATVTMNALAFDGRPAAQQAQAMTISWVPVVCSDPPNDSYFACYPGFAAALPAGVDLTAVLTQGPSLSFEMPADVITAHAQPLSGSAYGMVVVFAIACAGHVERVDRTADTVPPAPPLGCLDENGTELGPDDSVFAYAQVFSFAGRTNANPVISNLTRGGMAVDATSGITLTACAAGSKCPSVDLDTEVPSSSQELDPGDLNVNGTPLHEEIWVDYYLTAGTVGTSGLLYDATAGKLADSSVKLTAPATAGENSLWAVARDNRGGVSWLEVPLHVE
jgi:hypothetical protein